MPDDPYRPFAIGPIPDELLDAGGFVDLLAAAEPERPVPEAGLYAGLMTDGWLQALAYPDRVTGNDDD